MKSTFIGVDFSKQTIDVAILKQSKKSQKEFACLKFSNDEESYKELFQWIKEQTHTPQEQWLICGENTGLYSLGLQRFLNLRHIFFWLENPLQIKRAQGMVRGKNDKMDACQIALYAYRFQDKACNVELRNDILDMIRDLLVLRERLIKNKKQLLTASKELVRVKNNQTSAFIDEHTNKLIKCIIDEIKETEKKILELIKEDEQIEENFDRLCSIKGVGFVNAIWMIIATNNFIDFNDPRKFGCYAGCVPFNYESGTSVYRPDRVSAFANRRIKTILTCAAASAIRYNENIKAYYWKKKTEGKPWRLIVNNVRNKLIHLMFAIIRSQRTYQENYVPAFNQKNADSTRLNLAQS